MLEPGESGSWRGGMGYGRRDTSAGVSGQQLHSLALPTVATCFIYLAAKALNERP
jgi:hypothetical protein